jgi:hypothetical protein
MSFNFNLAALTESARDRLAHLETQGSALRDRLLSPTSRGSTGSPVPRGVALPSPPPRGFAGELLTSVELVVYGEPFLSGGGGAPPASLCLR